MKKGLLGKKAISLWLSWVILVGFVVALSGFLLGWMQSYSKDSVDAMKERVYNTQICESVSMSIEKIFCKNPQLLNMVITNRNKFRINQIILRTYDIDKNINVYYINRTIKPRSTVSIDVSNVINASSIEVIPVYVDDESTHICDNKKLSVMKIKGNC